MSYNNNKYGNSSSYVSYPRLYAELPIPRCLTPEGRSKINASINQTKITPQDRYCNSSPSILGTYSSCGSCSLAPTCYYYNSTDAGASPF